MMGGGRFFTPVVKWLLIANIAVLLLQILWTRPMVPSDLPVFKTDPVVAEKTLAIKMMEIGYPPATGVVEGWFALKVDKVLQGQVWRLVTSAFCHSTDMVMHIVFNMLLLVWIGRVLEQMYGSREFLLFYLGAALMGSLLFVGLELVTKSGGSAVGASGAIMGLMMLFAIHFPRQRVYLFFAIPIEMRWLMIGLVLIDLYPSIAALTGHDLHTGIAHASHLGGLFFGLAYHRLGWRLERLLPASLQRAAPTRHRSAAAGNAGPAPTPAREKKPRPTNVEKRVNELLDKISEHGMHSLTDEERAFLDKASRHYRTRK